MKRSKALNIIKEVLSGIDKNYNLQNEAESILERLEAEGMLPPLVYYNSKEDAYEWEKE